MSPPRVGKSVKKEVEGGIKHRRFLKVRDLVIKYLTETKQFASILDAYNVAREVFPNYVWSTETLEHLSRHLTSSEEIIRLDLPVPNTTPVRIFPNHHSMSIVTYFILATGNHDIDMALAKAELQELTNQALTRYSSTKKKTKQPGKNENPLLIEDITLRNEKIKMTRSSATSKNGFITKTRIRNFILHQFISTTFGYNTFSVKECLNNMPFSLIALVLGVVEIPGIMISYPQLRHLLYSSLPSSLKNRCFLPSIREDLYKELFLMSPFNRNRLTHTILYNSSSNFSLYDKQIISFSGLYTFVFPSSGEKNIRLFWNLFRAMELMEFADAYSSSIWVKRYAPFAKSRASPLVCEIVNKVIKEPLYTTYPYFPVQIEEFVRKIGVNWATAITALPKLEDLPRRTVRAIKIPPTGPISKFMFSESSSLFFSRAEPYTIYQKLVGEEKRFLSKNPVVSMNRIAALSVISTTGYIGHLPRPWTTARDIYIREGVDFDSFFGQSTSPNNTHVQLLTTDQSYKDLYNSTLFTFSTSLLFPEYTNLSYEDLVTSLQSPDTVDNITIDNHFSYKETTEMTCSDYNNRFNVTTLGFRLDPSESELLEAMKLLSANPGVPPIIASPALYSIPFNNIDSPSILLKYMKTQPSKSLIYVFPKTPVSYLSEIRDTLQTIRSLDHSTCQLAGKVTSSPGSLSILIEPSTPISLTLSPSLNLIKASKTLSAQAKFSFSYLEHFSLAELQLPKLPELSMEFDSTQFKWTQSEYPIDFAEALKNAYMQIYLVQYQLKQSAQMDKIFHARLVYSFILNSGIKGISFNTIAEQAGGVSTAFIREAIDFLEEFDFIQRLRVGGAPVYVADVLKRPPIDRNISAVNRVIMKIYEIIRESVGIEILSIWREISTLTLNEILEAVRILELDGVVVCRWEREGVPTRPLSEAEFLDEVDEALLNGTEPQIEIRLYLVEDGLKRLAQTCIDF